jgi:hypothetical protein
MEKYRLIRQLYYKIDDAFSWSNVEELFKDVMCVKLALTNSGTTSDDEIDVLLRIPVGKLMLLDDLSRIDSSTIRYLTRECNLPDLLRIQSTAEYEAFDSVGPSNSPAFIHRNTPVFPSATDYAKIYREQLDDIFCYDIYSDGDDYVVKLKFDHLKHHNTIAFPVPLLLKEKPENIPYTISSRNSSIFLSITVLRNIYYEFVLA